MKVIYVIDSISNINYKIDLLKNKFGNDIVFVVNAKFVKFFQTYGYTINAVYSKNLPEVIHALLSKIEQLDDIIYMQSSLEINDKILNKFITEIRANSNKIISVEPYYSFFEQCGNAIYNIYCKSLFKAKDSLCSCKMQYLPKPFVEELLATHFANKLFEINQNMCKQLHFEEKEINNNFKTKTGFNKNMLVPIIIALTLTIALFTTMVLLQGMNYIAGLIFFALYVLDILFAIIYQCKLYFDKRFFDRD